MTAYLIWSNQHHMWWRANERGYTDSIEEAGRYPHEQAARIVAKASVDGLLLVDRTDPVTGRQYRQAPEVMVLAPDGTGQRRQPVGYDPNPTILVGVLSATEVAAAYQRYANTLDNSRPGWHEDDESRMAPSLARLAVQRRKQAEVTS